MTLAECLQIRPQITQGPTAAPDSAFQSISSFVIPCLVVGILITSRLGDYFEKCCLIEAAKNISHIEA